MPYRVFGCYFCHGWQYVRSGQRTRICPYCGKKLIMLKIQPVANANKISDAIAIVKKLKADGRNPKISENSGLQ